MKLENLSIQRALKKGGYIPEEMTADEFQLEFRIFAHKACRTIDLTDLDFIAKKLAVNLADLIVRLIKIIKL